MPKESHAESRLPFHLIDTSIIHDTLAVIANEVKQSSKTRMHFFKPSGLPRRLRLLAMTKHSGLPRRFHLLMELLVERLAIPLSNQKTVAKWLVIANRPSQQAGKSLVIAMTRCPGFPEFAGMTCQFFNFPLPHSARCVTVIKYGNLNKHAGLAACRSRKKQVGRGLQGLVKFHPQTADRGLSIDFRRHPENCHRFRGHDE